MASYGGEAAIWPRCAAVGARPVVWPTLLARTHLVGVGVRVGVGVGVRLGLGLGLGLGTHPQPLARLRLLRVLDGCRAALQPGGEAIRLRRLPPKVARQAHLQIGCSV